MYKYIITSTLTGRHGNSYSRIRTGGARLVGVLNEKTSVSVADIGLEPNSIIPHLQTRDSEFKWQTYYSTVPGLNQYLILTHAQSTNLSGAGRVKIASQNNEYPDVSLNHFGNGVIDHTNNSYIDDIYDAYQKNHQLMTEQGYVLLNPNPQQVTIDKEYIKDNANSIYHYHGSCAIGEVVDENQKVYNVDNVYIGDISVLNHTWGGSTSVPALMTGYKASKNVI